jgi:NaMN:DMB phosphoribosyltransferase
MRPELRGRLLAGHRSVEPAHEHLLTWLGLRPLLELDLRLGEGSGAATALLLVQAACALHDRMGTFADAGVAAGEPADAPAAAPASVEGRLSHDSCGPVVLRRPGGGGVEA